MLKEDDTTHELELQQVRSNVQGMSMQECKAIAGRCLALVEPLGEHFGTGLSTVRAAQEMVHKNADRGVWGDDSYAEMTADTRLATAITIQSTYSVARTYNKNFARKILSIIESDIHTINTRSKEGADKDATLKLPEGPITEVKYWIEMVAYGQVSDIDWNDLGEIPSVLRPLRVFLCHSSNDKEVVRKLCYRLVKDGFDVWFDEEKLLPGQDWNLEITRAVRSTDVVIICLSSGSVSKAGYVQKEIKYALNVADEQPEGTIFLIPLRLDACNVPERLRNVQWVDYFDPNGYRRLIGALRLRSANVSRPSQAV